MEKKIFIVHSLCETNDTAGSSTILTATSDEQHAHDVRQKEWDGMFESGAMFSGYPVDDLTIEKCGDAWSCFNHFDGVTYAEVSVDELSYDTAVFWFNACKYSQADVLYFSRERCESLANDDEENVIKYNESIEWLLNNDWVDVDNGYVRVFDL